MFRLILVPGKGSINIRVANKDQRSLATSLGLRLDGTGDHKIQLMQVDNRTEILLEVRDLERLRSFVGLFRLTRFKFADEPESDAKSLDELIEVVKQGQASLETVISRLMEKLPDQITGRLDSKEYLLTSLQILRLAYWSLKKNKFSAPEVKLRILAIFLSYQKYVSLKSPSPSTAEIVFGSQPKELPTSDELKVTISEFRTQYQI